VTRAGKTEPMTEPVTLPNDIKVATNGTFTVKSGKERQLKEGQVLGKDGMLTSSDGSIEPVFDHVALKAGKMMLVKDGQSSLLTTELRLEDGSRVTPDGTLTTKDGRQRRLLDGQLVRLNGAELPAKDTIILRQGQVWVQKDGSPLKVDPGRSIMMNDGTKVLGDGTVIMKDGKRVKLTEGEILTIEGVVTTKPSGGRY
jgi:hypothetical protein